MDYLEKDCITLQTEKFEIGFYFKRFLQNTRDSEIHLKND